MSKTKKVGSAGKFGARYGRKIRQQVSEVEKKQKSLYICPNCHKIKVKRLSSGIWLCKKCNTKFAGKAYSLS